MRDLVGVERSCCPECVSRYSSASGRPLHWTDYGKSCFEFKLANSSSLTRKSTASSALLSTTDEPVSLSTIEEQDFLCSTPPSSSISTSTSAGFGPAAFCLSGPAEAGVCQCGCPAAAHTPTSFTESESQAIDSLRPVFRDIAPLPIAVELAISTSRKLAEERGGPGAARNDEFVYGEILENTFLPFLNSLFREFGATETADSGIFYDLGCGAGKAALLAACSEWQFQKSIGVELLSELLQLGVSIRDIVRDNLMVRSEMEKVSFECEDLHSFRPGADARVIYVAATMFGPDLLRSIRRNLEGISDEALIVTIKNRLPDVEVLKVVELICSWGVSKAYVCKLAVLSDDGGAG